MAGKNLHICFLWHMHQPYYRDPLTGTFSLPWVRLHATKSYYDMPRTAEGYPELGMTFNLVPSLLAQLEDYARGEGRDVLLEQSAKPAADLAPDERRSILANFFMCNWETMIKPYPGYWRLLTRRGLRLDEATLEEAMKRFSVQDYRDLQVWFNLAWFGFTAVNDDQGLRDLKNKGRLFSEDDKAYVLAAQARVVAEIVPVYKRLAEKGKVEVSATPFYHPILPLLIDTDIARRAMPHAILPTRFSHPEDAKAQIEKAVAYHASLFGKAPRGMWPSEGSVCPEVIPIVAGAGLKWLATDEAVLFNSLAGMFDRRTLFEPYVVGEPGAQVQMLFRDRGISDLIGFTYGRDPAHDSAGDLYRKFCQIRDGYTGTREPVVAVILDGENPWEYYHDGGETFLHDLFRAIQADPRMEAESLGDYVASHPADKHLAHLHSGSWINANYEIWIGGVEENRAWNILGETRNDLVRIQREGGPFPEGAMERAWEELYAAEGSDWFWWYGDQFSSDNDVEFDRLFRLHLTNIYSVLDLKAPDELGEPIIVGHRVKPLWEPIEFISPNIDGLETNYYEWKGSGLYRLGGGQAAMYRSERYVAGMFYGFNLDHLFLRLDPATELTELPEDVEVLVELEAGEKRSFRVRFPYHFGAENLSYILYRLSPEHEEAAEVGRSGSVAARRILEMAIPFEWLGTAPEEEVRIHVELKRKGLLVERIPRSGFISIQMPNPNFERINWSV